KHRKQALRSAHQHPAHGGTLWPSVSSGASVVESEQEKKVLKSLDRSAEADLGAAVLAAPPSRWHGRRHHGSHPTEEPMSLRINHNIASINGHRNMLKNDMAISKSLEKLSSGLKINRAADDAAGLIISEQMR